MKVCSYCVFFFFGRGNFFCYFHLGKGVLSRATIVWTCKNRWWYASSRLILFCDNIFKLSAISQPGGIEICWSRICVCVCACMHICACLARKFFEYIKYVRIIILYEKLRLGFFSSVRWVREYRVYVSSDWHRDSRIYENESNSANLTNRLCLLSALYWVEAQKCARTFRKRWVGR